MTLLLDTSVVIASLDADEPHHAVCDRLLSTGGHRLFVHALAETFSILTGSRISRRLGPDTAAELIASAVLPFVELVRLTGREMMMALTEAPHRGARGGAVYDWLHLVAARKAGVDPLVTLDRRDSMALTRPGDPAVRTP